MKPTTILTALLLTISTALLSADPPPNVILIITDQHSGIVMTQQGYPHITTPGIDKIAELGVTFTRGYCTNPVCTSSRKSFMTGFMSEKVDDVTKFPSLGMSMNNAGYETAYYGKWHVGSTHMEDLENWHGYDSYIDSRNDTDIRNWSIDFIKKDHAKPFFLVTSFLNPHDCCELARNMAGIDDNYHDGGVVINVDSSYFPPLPDNYAIPAFEPEGFYGRRNQGPDDRYWKAHPTLGWTQEKWRQYMYGYDRFVEKVDAHVKKMMDELESQGLLENTVIIYTADHGDGHASHQWNQKKTFYEESVNIPFVISWKGKTQSGVIDDETVVSNGLDIFPTIAGFAGITPPEMPGEDLSTLVMGQTTKKSLAERNYVVSEINQKVYKGITPGTFAGRMLVTNKLKYILFDKGVNREMLIDIVNDPGELNPVTNDPEFADDLEQCRADLKTWCEMTGDYFDVDAIVEEYDQIALLDSLFLNGTAISGFEREKYRYVCDSVDNESIYIKTVAVNPGVNVIIDLPEDIRGDSAAQTARIMVLPKNGTLAEVYYLQIPGRALVSGIEKYSRFRTEVFPNPAHNEIHIRNTADRIRLVELFDESGKRLKRLHTNEYHVTMNISAYDTKKLLVRSSLASGASHSSMIMIAK